MPRKVKLSSRSHSRKAIASVTACLVERHRRVAEIGDRVVEAGQHRLPVLDRRPHLAEHLAEPRLQPFRPVLRKPADMHLDDADAVARSGRAWRIRGKDLGDAGLAVPDRHHRMDDQRRLAGAFGDFAEHGIEQERHVVVDDRDHRHRPPVGVDARLGADVDDAGPRQMAGDRFVGDRDRVFEIGGLVAGEILCGARARRWSWRSLTPALALPTLPAPAALVFAFTAMVFVPPAACFCALS